MPNPEEENSPPLSVREEPTRRPILEYFQLVTGNDRFWRMFSSREKVIEALKTLGWVAPLTLLIWIYAVREQVVQPNSPNAIGVQIHIYTSDNNDLYVENARPDEATVNLQLTGPQQNLESVKEKLLTDIPRGVNIDLGTTMGPGKGQPVNIVDRIQNMEIFRSNGVTVQQSQPPEIRVNIYAKKSRVVPVMVPSNIPNLSSETRFDPPKVTISGPAELVDQVDKVYAKLDAAQLLKQPPGSHTITGVPLEFLPDQPKLTMSANQVTANLVVTASDQTYVIPDAIILDEVIPATVSGYDIVFDNPGDKSIPNIQIHGPQQAIDSITKDKSFTVQVQLKIAAEDAGSTNPVTRALTYVLPEGVTVLNPRTVKFTLVPRP